MTIGVYISGVIYYRLERFIKLILDWTWVDVFDDVYDFLNNIIIYIVFILYY